MINSCINLQSYSLNIFFLMYGYCVFSLTFHISCHTVYECSGVIFVTVYNDTPETDLYQYPKNLGNKLVVFRPFCIVEK